MSKYLFQYTKINRNLIEIIQCYCLQSLKDINNYKTKNMRNLENKTALIYFKLRDQYCYDIDLKHYTNLINTKIIKYNSYWTIVKQIKNE